MRIEGCYLASVNSTLREMVAFHAVHRVLVRQLSCNNFFILYMKFYKHSGTCTCKLMTSCLRIARTLLLGCWALHASILILFFLPGVVVIEVMQVWGGECDGCD